VSTGHLVCLAGRTLRDPIAYTIETGGLAGVRLWCAEFQVWGCGDHLAAALAELTGVLTATWQDYVTTPDDALTPAGRAEKHRLRWLMGDIA
jgi:hypothetical protein